MMDDFPVVTPDLKKNGSFGIREIWDRTHLLQCIFKIVFMKIVP